MTTATRSKSDELERQLDAAKRLGAIVEYERVSTGKELIWRLALPADANLELKTKEAGLFLLGVDLGRQLTGGARRNRKPNAVRDAIVRDGRIELDIEDPADASAVRRQRNGLFANAYAVGFKGRFRVRREGDKLIGEVAA